MGKILSKNKLIYYYGKGPENKRCKHCDHCYSKHFAGTYYKCDLRQCTNGPGSDHRANWPTCGKFKENGIEFKTDEQLKIERPDFGLKDLPLFEGE
jgi:hypothetical protein